MPDYTVLVVDYEPRTAEVVAMVAGEAGLRVETAKDGLAAIEAFKKLRPVLTLIEFMLPRKPGLDVCRELRNSVEGKDAKLVVMSSRFRGRQYRADAIRTYGADEFVEKPIDRDKVAGLLERLIKPRLAELESAAAAAPVVAAAPPEATATAKHVGSTIAPRSPAPPRSPVPSSAPVPSQSAAAAAPAPLAHAAETALEEDIEDHIDTVLDF